MEDKQQAGRLIETATELGRAEDRYMVLAREACRLVQNVVQWQLATPADVIGLDLIGELAKDSGIARFDIATLNHDLLIETYLTRNGLPFLDGFAAPQDGLRRFTPKLFDRGARTRFLKLHGSIDWQRYQRAEGVDLYAISVGGLHERVTDSSGVNWGRVDGPLFLAGTNNKILDYGAGIFAEQFYRFHQVLGEHDTIIVSGYGFGDKGINGRFWDWLFGDTGRNMIILHRDPDALRRGARRSYTNMLDTFGREGRIVVVEKWMQNCSFSGDLHGLVFR